MVHRILVGLLVHCLPFFSNSVAGQDAGSVVRIEEDWELFLGNPAPQIVVPEVTSVTAGEADLLHAVFHLNQRPRHLRAQSEATGVGAQRGIGPNV